ncbi:Adaptive-response sensory-kinase SasA [bioreactor metagenome]|uniref:histidine kinase n=1 Tax=bioreactor metagenome TaxID=1076179 RepID=A0A644XGN5_9ZZZZ
MGKGEDRVSLLSSIQFKFASTYILVILAVLILLNTYPVLVSQDLVFQSKQTSLQNEASVISSALAVSEVLTPDGVKQVMTLLDEMGMTRIIVTDSAGRVLYDTMEGEDGLNRYALLWEVAGALRGNDMFHSEFRNGTFYSRAAAPVVARGNNIGAVCLYENDAEQGALLLGVQNNLRSISLVLCLVVMGLSVVISKVVTRRIAALLNAIRIVREGHYSHRVQMVGKDELSQLAGEFNQLTGRLQTTEEVRRRFVSDASHELKTPLASIRLLTDSILQNRDIDTETVRDFVSDIGEEADRLTRISEKLLTLTRLDAGQAPSAVPVDVGAVAEKVCHMLSPLAADRKVAINTTLAPGCIVLASVDDLYQVIFNLLENAIKYNLQGGSVTVTLERGGGITIIVEDTGVGIPEEDLPRVFDRFYRVDKARSRAAGGTGLGLSIVRDTVELYGGTVSAQRRERGGARFVVTFPECAQQIPAGEKAPEGEGPHERETPTSGEEQAAEETPPEESFLDPEGRGRS